MVQEIINEVNEFLAKDGRVLPKRGILTGQFPASLYLEKIGFSLYKERKELIVNDVDVFVQSKSKTENSLMRKMTKEKLEKIYDYGRIFGVCEEDNYKITRTKHLDSLNITFFRTYDINKKMTAPELVSRFDINCTQLAIDLETKEIYLSDAFKAFIETGQLQIVDLATPFHTAIRLVKKAFEFGFYCNFEKEFSKLQLLEGSSKYFGRKYFEYFSKHIDILGEYYELKTIIPAIDWKIDDEDEADKIIWKAAKLYTLEAKANEKISSYIKFHCEIGDHTTMSILNTNDIFFLQSEMRKQNIIKEINSIEKEFYYEHPIALIFKKHFHRKDISFANFKSVHKMLKMHRDLANAYYSFDTYEDMMEFHKNLNKLVFEKGSSIIGILENTSRAIYPKDFNGLMEFYDFEMNKLSAELIKRSVNDFSFAYWKFTEYTKTIELFDEGTRMHHCISGFGSSVQSGVSKILSLRSTNLNQKDFTLELRRVSNNIYYISQCMGKFNKPIESHWIDTFVREINKHTSAIRVITEKELGQNLEKKANNNFIPVYYEDDELPF